jgi:hypothetical protein
VAVETLAGIRTLMLHPAFAYGLVVLALLPNLILWRAAREAAAPATARSVPLAVTAPPHAEPPAQGYDMRALREEDVAGHATALMAPDARKAEAVARAAREPAENGTLEGLATAARPSPQAPRKPEAHWTTVVLGAGLGLAAAGESADDLPSVARAELDAGIELKLPVRVFRVGGPFEVQITKPDGASKLSQSFPSATVGLVSMNIPAAWLTPGQYQVAMRSATESSREFARFRFEVH